MASLDTATYISPTVVFRELHPLPEEHQDTWAPVLLVHWEDNRPGLVQLRFEPLDCCCSNERRRSWAARCLEYIARSDALYGAFLMGANAAVLM